MNGKNLVSILMDFCDREGISYREEDGLGWIDGVIDWEELALYFDERMKIEKENK